MDGRAAVLAENWRSCCEARGRAMRVNARMVVMVVSSLRRMLAL